MTLSAKIDETQLSKDDDLFWALVKYAENVQECAVQLDNINDSIFACLAEFPMKTENEELSWDGLKGMRSRLAHRFWDINPAVIWNTATTDFPELDDLLGSLSMSNVMADFEDQLRAWIEAADFRRLHPIEAGATIRPGNSIPFLYFDSIGKAQSLRIGRSTDNGLILARSKTGSIKLNVGVIREIHAWPACNSSIWQDGTTPVLQAIRYDSCMRCRCKTSVLPVAPRIPVLP